MLPTITRTRRGTQPLFKDVAHLAPGVPDGLAQRNVTAPNQGTLVDALREHMGRYALVYKSGALYCQQHVVGVDESQRVDVFMNEGAANIESESHGGKMEAVEINENFLERLARDYK